MNSDDTPKWKLVENVVTAIERSLTTVEGAKVIPNASIRERASDVARQVDAYVEIPTGPRTLRVGLEVRDESVAVDLPEIEQLITKLKKLDIDYGCIVSRAGFTTTAQSEADRNGIEIRTLAEVENPEWWLPTSITIHHNQVELVHFQINFRQEELPQVRKGFVYGMLLGTFAGLVDSTLGWFVSRMVGPFLRTDIPKLEPLIIAIVIIVVTASAFALGSLGALLCKLLGRTKTADA
jgi:hypothetical protein